MRFIIPFQIIKKVLYRLCIIGAVFVMVPVLYFVIDSIFPSLAENDYKNSVRNDALLGKWISNRSDSSIICWEFRNNAIAIFNKGNFSQDFIWKNDTGNLSLLLPDKVSQYYMRRQITLSIRLSGDTLFINSKPFLRR